MPNVTDGPTIQDITIVRGAPFIMDGTVTFTPSSGSTLVGSTITFQLDPDLQDWWSQLPIPSSSALLTKTNSSGITIDDATHYSISFDGSEFLDATVYPFGDVRWYSISAVFSGSRPFELQCGLLYVEER